MDWPTAHVLHKVQWGMWDGLVGPPVRDHWGGGPRRWGGPVLSKWSGRDRNISSVAPSFATECSRLRVCRVGSSGGEGSGWLRLRPRFSGASSVFTRALIGVPARVWAARVGEAGAGMGVGRTPRVPGQVPAAGPPVLSSLSVPLSRFRNVLATRDRRVSAASAGLWALCQRQRPQ
jgi:hypothetical protein